jgi:hypothetical protein
MNLNHVNPSSRRNFVTHTNPLKLLARVIAVVLMSPLAASAENGDFARANYVTDLRGVCPDPIVIQKDWLMEIEHAAFYQLIGAGGTSSDGQYTGPLGSTGVQLTVLEGGSGFGMGDGESAAMTLYTGNSKAGLTPHLAFVGTDTAFIQSALFPVIGVVAPLDKNPQMLFWDPATYPAGFRSVDALKSLADGDGKIHLSTINREYGKFLADSGISTDVFVEGYYGSPENFLINNGKWLNQGYVTSEVFKYENGNGWGKPVDYVLIADLGYDIYPSVPSIAANRLDELAPCLAKLVPLIQQAQVDFAADPAEINELIEAFNIAGHGAGFWKTSRAQNDAGVKVALENGVIGNGANATLGDFDFARISELLAILAPSFDERAKPGVAGNDIATNQFIDMTIGSN